MANIHDTTRDQWMLQGALSRKGYDWWWHSLTAHHAVSGEEKAFFFEFFTCNPAQGDANVHYGQKGEIPSYLMVKCGTWGEDARQLHRFFAWNDVTMRPGTPFGVEAQDCYLSETHSEGHVHVSPQESAEHAEWMCQSGEMTWKLDIHKEVAFNVGYGANRFFRYLNAFEMYWHAEGMKTTYEGWIEWNGERYVVRPEDCYGYADKNWGENFTSPWVWLSSCNLRSRISGKELQNTVFDIGGGCPKAFGIALKRKLLSNIWYEGRDFEFNFSKFWTLTRTRFACQETDTHMIWHVEQSNLQGAMIVDIACEKKQMLLVNYESPDGKRRHTRLWNGGTGEGTIKLYERKGRHLHLVDEMEAKNIGCEYGEYEKKELQ